MRKLLFFFIIFLLAFSVQANQLQPVKYLIDDNPDIERSEYVETSWPLPASEIDEYVGDTVIVGLTMWDSQHNATVGRQIQFDPNGDNGNGVVYVLYADQPDDGGIRRTKLNRIHFDQDYPYTEVLEGYQMGTQHWNGYPTLALSPLTDNWIPVCCFHERAQAASPYLSRVGQELTLIPGVFTDMMLPWEDTSWNAWPRSAMDGDSIVHVATTENAGDAAERVMYYRVRVEAGPAFDITNGNGDGELVTDIADFPSCDVACTPDGQRVAIGMPIVRGAMGNAPESHDSDKDMIVWLNEDYGRNWDWDINNTMNITQYTGPDLGQLPDTLAADADTFRLWLDCHLYFDNDNILHSAWSSSQYYYLEDQGTIYSQIFYWNEEDQYFIRVGDGDFWNNWSGATPVPGFNNMLIGRPNIVRDPENNWIYMVFEQYGVPGDTLNGQPLDVNQDGRPNAELFVTASPSGSTEWGRDFEVNGKLWFKPVNITNSRGGIDPLPPGECRSERDPSFALNCDGDYLHLFYQIDLDAGTSIGDSPEGVQTNNPMVYCRLSKAELAEMFIDQGEWIRNIPMHVNEDGYWEDPEDWAWEYLSTEIDDPELPDEFAINRIYPNPFNPGTEIEFSINSSSNIKLVVYDVLGREVTTLVERHLNQGNHSVYFDGSSLASGIYFVELSNGRYSVNEKLVLVK